MTQPSFASREDFPHTPNDPRHGTLNGYNNLRCRCDHCRAAANAYMRDYYRRMLARPRPELAHGTESRYCAGCRCTACREASALARWNRRWASAEAIEKRRAYDRQRKSRAAAEVKQ